jgi:DNA modification methylase
MEVISIAEVITSNRMRKDLGDIPALAASIKENGLIQPIRLSKIRENDLFHIKLVAGERRLRALIHLGLTVLNHQEHFLWLGEEDPLRLKSIELEENLRRQNLTWQEELEGKRQLMEIMQKLYGPAESRRPTKKEEHGLTPRGFGIRSLSRLLGESYKKTHKDMVIAEAVKMAPALAEADSKEAAFRKFNIATVMASMMKAATARKEDKPEEEHWKLYEGDFADNANSIDNSSIDYILTDLPFGAGCQGGPYHFPGVTNFDNDPNSSDNTVSILKQLDTIAKESFRVLKDNRYACFFFGFNFYGDLVESLRKAGFKVVLMPVIWVKNTMSGENPHFLYRHSYETVLYARKGDARFIRQGQKDVKIFPTVLPKDKLMAVEKPIDLLVDFLTDMTTEGALCLDWMAGTGSFGEACLRVKRDVILCEKDPVACSMIKARLGRLD